MIYKVIKGQKFRHYKGSYHKVVTTAIHSETKEGLVIYTDGNYIWARPVKMFFGNLENGVKRFTLVN